MVCAHHVCVLSWPQMKGPIPKYPYAPNIKKHIGGLGCASLGDYAHSLKL